MPQAWTSIDRRYIINTRAVSFINVNIKIQDNWKFLLLANIIYLHKIFYTAILLVDQDQVGFMISGKPNSNCCLPQDKILSFNKQLT